MTSTTAEPELRAVEHEHARRQYVLITRAVDAGAEAVAVLYLPPRDPADSGLSCVALVDVPKLHHGDFSDDYFVPICGDCLLGQQPELALPFALAREHGGAVRDGAHWEPRRQ